MWRFVIGFFVGLGVGLALRSEHGRSLRWEESVARTQERVAAMLADAQEVLKQVKEELAETVEAQRPVAEEAGQRRKRG